MPAPDGLLERTPPAVTAGRSPAAAAQTATIPACLARVLHPSPSTDVGLEVRPWHATDGI